MPLDTERHFPEALRVPWGTRDGSLTKIGEISPSHTAVIERLLEDGDRADLQWLCGELGESRLAQWAQARGGRQLSKRSRLFWQLILGVAPGQPSEVREALWPL